MTIIKDKEYISKLLDILRFIKQDKPMAAKKFEKELESKIKNLSDFPYKHRASIYFDDKSYRDLIYKGYTIIYKVEKNIILILEIFKWQNH